MPFEEFIKALAQKLGPTTSAYLGVGALVIVVLPSLIKAWVTWEDSRSGVRAVTKERARLELLKLWLEVEGLKKEHNVEIPILLQPPPAAATTPSPHTRVEALLGQAASPAEKSVTRPGVWRWLAALDRHHHLLSGLALTLLTAIALLAAVLGVFLLIVAFQIITQRSDIVFTGILVVLELSVLLLLRALFRQRKLLRLAQQQSVAYRPKA